MIRKKKKTKGGAVALQDTGYLCFIEMLKALRQIQDLLSEAGSLPTLKPVANG